MTQWFNIANALFKESASFRKKESKKWPEKKRSQRGENVNANYMSRQRRHHSCSSIYSEHNSYTNWCLCLCLSRKKISSSRYFFHLQHLCSLFMLLILFIFALQPTSCVFIENPLCRSKRLPWQKSSVTTWLESDSKLFIKKTKHQKSKKSNRNNNSKKIPQIFVYRREKKPVCAKALKLNFFTNYYFSCSYFLQRIVAKYWSLPLLLKSTELLYKLFYEKISCSAGSLGAATRRVIFVLPLFAIPLLSCLLSCKFIFWRAAALPCEFFARRSESSVWHLFWYVSHSLWWMKTTNNKKRTLRQSFFSFFLWTLKICLRNSFFLAWR